MRSADESLSSFSHGRAQEKTAQCLGAVLRLLDPERAVGSGRPLEPGDEE